MSKILLHKHHIIPRHAGGTDDPSNLVELTILDHAIAHKVLYGLYGRWQDKVAWLSLSDQINTAEANRLATIERNKTRKLSQETIEKHRQNFRNWFSNPENKEKHRIATKKAMKNIPLNHGAFKKGHIPWSKGKVGFMSEAGREAIRAANKRRAKVA
jgi:hypothetical protein